MRRAFIAATIALLSISVSANSAKAGFFIPVVIKLILGKAAISGLALKGMAASKLSLAGKTFYFGSAAITGYALYKMFDDAGYALPNDPLIHEQIAEDIMKMKNRGAKGYQPLLCPLEDGSMVAVSELYFSCPFTPEETLSTRGSEHILF